MKTNFTALSILLQTNIYDITKIQYSVNYGSNWNDIVEWPCDLTNLNISNSNLEIFEKIKSKHIV